MVWESPEGIAEYAKIGKPYPKTVFDQDFTAFMHKIAWDPNKKETIREITRIKLADDTEFLTYSSRWEGMINCMVIMINATDVSLEFTRELKS